MRLKAQRRNLAIGLGAVTALGLALGGVAFSESQSPEVVRLGKGLASVDAKKVADIEPRTTIAERPTTEPEPAASESPMADGEASYYGSELAGNLTASGEAFDPSQLTAAHRFLPLGSKVRVTNPRSGQAVVVRINDRGPFHGNRVIDLSTAAARKIGLIRSGTGRVRLALLLD
ncbi:septal ring lytic transglycosylase RlpA family protein [Erythrobacter sp. SD-21]|uniref:septal ring lytic transglycosylase RlpA family protein n=1 Tax=Erythrobacter sp. SD-21 TaxID=161528 RepID=UPI000153FD1C|nr:septal ring lytic transglycosylase RlpA family protein [Erythrobacter sp. SD-21]EDL49178.1 rare lipoprotein A [Erythrobacter sp. SD-21]